MPNMDARKIIHAKEIWQDGTVVEMVVWALDRPVPGSGHPFKYRLYCGRAGQCIVRYDNERDKGDHKHYGSEETYYPFKSLEQLIQDFETDVRRLT